MRPMRTRMWLAFLLAACASGSRATTTPRAQEFVSDRISVEVRGAGPDIILIPGLGAHRDTWSKTAAALEGRHRLHLVQVHGFAGFPAGANAEGPVSAPVAEELARYIQAAGLERPAVIGHSMG